VRSRGGVCSALSPFQKKTGQKNAGKNKKEKKNKKKKKIRNKKKINKLKNISIAKTALGLLFVLLLFHHAADAQGIPPRREAPHAPHLVPSRFDLVAASDAIAACLPNAAATVAVFPREDIRGVDTLDLHAEGLRPNTTFAVFLTEMPVAPFGAVQYIGDFTTNAAGRGSVRVDAII